MGILQPTSPNREHLYFMYRVERGALERWGPDWAWEQPERVARLQYEARVIAGLGHESYFLILARILSWCHENRITTGPGRGSVGGSLLAYVLGIHELDSLEWDLSFERFLNPERVGLADVDLDVSQRDRPRVFQFVRQEFEDASTAVLQVAAFARAGARRTIDMVAAAKRSDDPQAEAIAVQLKRLLPEGANVTGGTKQEREIAWWLENGSNSKNQAQFRDLATQYGWLDTLLKLDGVQTHLAKHAAGVVIISREDLARLPQTGARDSQSGEWRMLTGYDMYALDDLQYLKIDILGLRTLDIVADAHRFCGGDGSTPALMELWRQQRDRNPQTYELLCAADTTGVFQVETSGYRRVLKDFQPRTYDHITQLNALYRPGALDSKREDGLNMVEVFIRRLHGKEPIAYPRELQGVLPEVLSSTQGIILFQEQSMKLAQVLAGFTGTEADNLRKAIGKKQLDRMAAIKPQFLQGMQERGYSVQGAETMWSAIEASSRYAWNSCLAEGTLIWTARGAIPIEDVRVGDITVAFAASGFVLEPIKAIYDNGLRVCAKLVLEDSTEILATPNHRFLDEEGYKSVDQIRVGDKLQVQHDSRSESVKSFAAVVTDGAESNKVPGWVVVYGTPRDDVVHWQFVPATIDTATDATDKTVSFANLVFESVRPRMGDRWITRRLTAAQIYQSFGADGGFEHVSDRCPVETKLSAEFGVRPIPLQVERTDLRTDGGWDAVVAIALESIGGQEATESGGTASEPQHFHDLLVRPAFPVEYQDCVPALFQLSQLLRASRMAVDETLGLPLDPSVLRMGPGGDGSRLAAATFAQFWNRVHSNIVPGVRRVRKITADPTPRRVFDLEMPRTHNFIANGIVSHNSHSRFYSVTTWWCAFFKANRVIDLPELGLEGPGTAAFYAALINSLDEDKDRQADAVAEARQHVQIKPPDINVALDSYTVEGEAIVFGLNGIKGMGEANRTAIILERWINGPFWSFVDFHRRLPSVPINMKLSLIKCGAFDSVETRERLLAVVPRTGPAGQLVDKDGNGKTWTVAEFLKHNASLKHPRELPDLTAWQFPNERQLAEGEMETIGFYVTAEPMVQVSRALRRLDASCHWGGEVVPGTVKLFKDRNDNEMARFTLLTTALNKQRCMVFASNWPQCKAQVVPGEQIIVRGHIDGSQLIADRVFAAGDYRQYKAVKISRNGTSQVQPFNGRIEEVELLEASGYVVQLL